MPLTIAVMRCVLPSNDRASAVGGPLLVTIAAPVSCMPLLGRRPVNGFFLVRTQDRDFSRDVRLGLTHLVKGFSQFPEARDVGTRKVGSQSPLLLGLAHETRSLERPRKDGARNGLQEVALLTATRAPAYAVNHHESKGSQKALIELVRVLGCERTETLIVSETRRIPRVSYGFELMPMPLRPIDPEL